MTSPIRWNRSGPTVTPSYGDAAGNVAPLGEKQQPSGDSVTRSPTGTDGANQAGTPAFSPQQEQALTALLLDMMSHLVGITGNTMGGASQTNKASTTTSTGAITGQPGPSSATQACPAGALDATTLGVKGDGSTDNTPALQNAINQAKASGQALYLPPGTYNHSGGIKADGVKIVGAGSGTVLNATSPFGGAITLTGEGAGLSNLAVNSPSDTRSSQPRDAAVLLQDANKATISNLSIQGASSNGIRLANSNNCSITSSFVNGSNGDGIALTAGSSNNLVQGCQVENAGDDSYSDDSYMGEKQDSGNTFDSDYAGPNFTQGRGFALMGSTNATVKNCVSDGAKDYGIIAGTDPNSATQAGSNFTLQNNLVTNNGAGSGKPTLLTTVGDVVGAQNDPSLGTVSGTQTSGDAQGLLGWSPLTTFTARSAFSAYAGGGAGSNNQSGNRT